jgi:tripeptide aminopeptidase
MAFSTENYEEMKMINPERLAETFSSLVQIDSVSRNEAAICSELRNILNDMGAETFVDDAGNAVGGNTGNLIARFRGSVDVPVMMLNAHMDTVEPGNGVKPVYKDGVFTSDGTTILGADDKSAVAILLEVLTVLQEDSLPHGPLEVVLTICEEIGLQGAKNLDISQLTAKFGYALDATDTAGIVTRAPGANYLKFMVYGKDAHAGAAPEKGINAIAIASKAIASLTIGRIDHETTCNIGVIQGGMATNIVPSQVMVNGEVRSHDSKKLADLTQTIVSAFETAVQDYVPQSAEAGRPWLEVEVIPDFTRTHIPDDHPVVILAMDAAQNLGRTLIPKITGGGADANVFFSKGIMTGVLGTGMRDMHTVREWVSLSDMLLTTELVLEIIRLHAL